MEKKGIGHVAAAILVVCGVGLVFLGKGVMYSGPSGDGGIYGLFGVLMMLVGGLMTAVTVVLWLFGTVVQIIGFKLAIVASVVLLFGASLLRPLFDIWPIEAGSWGGAIRSGPADWREQSGDLQAGTPVTLLGVMKESGKGYPWFRVRDDRGLEGFAWGGVLCATDVWVNGVFGRCPEATRAETVDEIDFGAEAPVIEMIEQAYTLLPGKWIPVYEAPIETPVATQVGGTGSASPGDQEIAYDVAVEAPIKTRSPFTTHLGRIDSASPGDQELVVYGDQRELSVYGEAGRQFVSGFWVIEENQRSPTKLLLRLAAGPDGEARWNYDKFSILSLNSRELTLEWMGVTPLTRATFRRVE